MNEDNDLRYFITAKGLIDMAVRQGKDAAGIWDELVAYGKRFAAGDGQAAVLLDGNGGRIVILVMDDGPTN